MGDYEERVSRELESYREERPELGLPPIFTYWAVQYIIPRLVEVMGVRTIPEFFAQHLNASLQRSSSQNLSSLGCGDCSTEIEIAKQLISIGNNEFKFFCYDISPFVMERARSSLAIEGMNDYFEFEVQDLNTWAPNTKFAAVMANHSLHHMVNLEHIFDTVRTSLVEEGAFVVADMIGRNGHMRWPEALDLVNSIWGFCPDAYKYNHLLSRFEERYDNWDCSKDGFEGIRAQDILPSLVERFHFERFIGFGNLPDIFVERTFGPNLKADNPRDIAFIDFLELLNTQLISSGVLKPTQMTAVMGKRSVPTIYDRGWSPQFCVRSTATAAEPKFDPVVVPAVSRMAQWIRTPRRIGRRARRLFAQ